MKPHTTPTVIVDSGASVQDREDIEQMLREQIHAQQCEINALRKALMYTHPAKTLTDEFIYKNHVGYLSPNNKFYAPDYPTWKQDGFTPIYKEPVAKTLTNEEIIEIREEVWDDNKFISEILFDFARAILRKAQEKC